MLTGESQYTAQLAHVIIACTITSVTITKFLTRGNRMKTQLLYTNSMSELHVSHM